MAISFVAFIIENESRLNHIRGQLKDFDYPDAPHDPVAHEEHAEQWGYMLDPKDEKPFGHFVVDKIAHGMDPTPQKKYTQYLVNQYKKQNFRLEDASRIHETMHNFDAHRARLEKKDINQYKHIDDVAGAVEKHLGASNENKAKFPDGPRFEHPEAKKIFDNGQGLTVHHLSTERAAVAARESCNHPTTSGGWCFGWRNNNYFNRYNRDGKIHLIQTPDNKKYALHFETGQLMDKDDRPADPRKLVADHPDLKNVDSFQPHVTTPEHSDAAFDRHLLQHDYGYRGHIDNLRKAFDNGKNSQSSPRDLHKYLMAKPENFQLSVAKNPKHQSDESSVHRALMHSPHVGVRREVATSARDDVVHAHLATDPHITVRDAVVRKTRSKAVLHHMGANDIDSGIRQKAKFRLKRDAYYGWLR